MSCAGRGLLPILTTICLSAAPQSTRSVNPAAQKLVDELYREKENPKAETWSPTVKKLIALGEAAVPTLEKGMHSGNDYVSNSCVTALEMIGGSAVDVFIRTLVSKTPRMRKRGLLGLAFVDNRTPSESIKVRTTLMPLVHAKDPETRKWAVYGLQRFRERESVLLIVRALQDPSAIVRREAALALRSTKDDFAGPALIRALESDDPELRSDAICALGFRHRDPGAFQALLRHRTDPSPKVRWMIVNYLANFGGKRSMKYLALFLGDNESCEFGNPSEAAASIISGMIGMKLNHSQESVERIRRWWEAIGSPRYGGLEVPDPCGQYPPPFIPSRILPQGWEFLFAEYCPAPPGWTSSVKDIPVDQDGACRHYRYWFPVTPDPESTAPYFDIYLAPLSWSGESRSGATRIMNGELAFEPPANGQEAAYPHEARFIGKSGHDFVFWYSDRLGTWETAPADFREYLKAK